MLIDLHFKHFDNLINNTVF